MPFDPTRYGPDIQRILALDGTGERMMPLAGGHCSSEGARRTLSAKSALSLFAGSFAPAAAMSGLWLYFSCFDEAHALAQDIPSSEGSYWHGILHRQEPDPSNAAYWFRRVGEHAIFPALHAEAAKLPSYRADSGLRLKNRWDPFAFIDFCTLAEGKPGSAEEQLALEIQRIEWQLLFDYCARPIEQAR